MRTVDDTRLWLRRFHPAGPGAPQVVCFPCAGGSAGAFFDLSAALSPEIEVLAVQYPGRQDRSRERPSTDLAELADEITDQLLARLGPAERPALFGHSMGSLVAFETALRLERAGRRPTVLFASSHRAPVDSGTGLDGLDDASITEELARLSGTDPEVLADEGLMELILPVLRADYTALARYRHVPGLLLACPVVAALGDADPEVSPEEAARWAEHTGAASSVRVFDGDHFYLKPRLHELADLVRTTVREAT